MMGSGSHTAVVGVGLAKSTSEAEVYIREDCSPPEPQASLPPQHSIPCAGVRLLRP